MRERITRAILVGALSAAVPVVGFAAGPGEAQAPAVAKQSPNIAATHATSGVVKTIDASTLVITRTSKAHREMTFVLNTSTHREGTIAVGTPVSVRYREDGKTYVATAVSVQQPRQQAARTGTPTR
jgi:hypothetical protein